MWGEPRVCAVVFDCDGVLVDTEEIWSAALRDVLRAWVGPDASVRATTMIGGSVPEVVAVLEQLCGRPVDADVVGQNIYRAVLSAIAHGVRAVPGAVELVSGLQGSRPLGIASNGSLETVAASLAAAGIPNVFDAVVALDGVRRPKPAPDLYQEACALLGVAPSSTVAIEDSRRGARAARTAGLTVVGLGAGGTLDAEADLVVESLFDPRLRALLSR